MLHASLSAHPSGPTGRGSCILPLPAPAALGAAETEEGRAAETLVAAIGADEVAEDEAGAAATLVEELERVN